MTGSSDSDSEEDAPKVVSSMTLLRLARAESASLTSLDSSHFQPITRPPTIFVPPPRGPPKPRLSPAPAATPTSTPKRPPRFTPSTPSRTATAPTLLTDAQRESLPLKLILELDRAVFRRSWSGGKCIDGPGEATGVGLPSGIEIKWNKKLRNTAGRASWKR